jgi:TetR/AcrR family transcriptional repressor of nem operon
MARIVNEKEYAERRNKILDVTQQLVYTRGYEQMSIQDILDELKISKGAFYHYFDSKQALLEALIERIRQEAEKILIPILDDSHLPALEKFRQFFDSVARWKTAQKDYLMALFRSWYHDDNAIVRQKVTGSMIEWYVPLLSTIIRQGIDEGVFYTRFPEQAGEVALVLIYGLGDNVARTLLSSDPAGQDLRSYEDAILAYSDALERVLGAPEGSLFLFDPVLMKDWMIST